MVTYAPLAKTDQTCSNTPLKMFVKSERSLLACSLCPTAKSMCVYMCLFVLLKYVRYCRAFVITRVRYNRVRLYSGDAKTTIPDGGGGCIKYCTSQPRLN